MVYPRDEPRSSFLAADQWTGAFFVFVNLFHARYVREFVKNTLYFLLMQRMSGNYLLVIRRIQNSDIPRAGLRGAAHGEAAGRSGAGQDRMPTSRFSQDTTTPFAHKASMASKTIVLNIFSEARTKEILCKPNLSSLKPGHTTGGSGRGGARRDGGAGRGGAGQDGTPTGRSTQETTIPHICRRSKKALLGVFLEERSKETLVKPIEEQKSG